jgi:uncharacterized membrane protein YeaQ/YmgE (transglycosylase-associated protein family)
MMLGVAGSFVGRVIGKLLGIYGPNEGAGFIMSTLGAILLLAIYRMAIRRRGMV